MAAISSSLLSVANAGDECVEQYDHPLRTRVVSDSCHQRRNERVQAIAIEFAERKVLVINRLKPCGGGAAKTLYLISLAG